MLACELGGTTRWGAERQRARCSPRWVRAATTPMPCCAARPRAIRRATRALPPGGAGSTPAVNRPSTLAAPRSNSSAATVRRASTRSAATRLQRAHPTMPAPRRFDASTSAALRPVTKIAWRTTRSDTNHPSRWRDARPMHAPITARGSDATMRVRTATAGLRRTRSRRNSCCSSVSSRPAAARTRWPRKASACVCVRRVQSPIARSRAVNSRRRQRANFDLLIQNHGGDNKGYTPFDGFLAFDDPEHDSPRIQRPCCSSTVRGRARGRARTSASTRCS